MQGLQVLALGGASPVKGTKKLQLAPGRFLGCQNSPGDRQAPRRPLMRPRSALGPAAEPRSRSRLDQMPGAFLIRTSYPQHIHNLETLEFDLFTGTCCAQIHRCAGKIETQHCGKKACRAA